MDYSSYRGRGKDKISGEERPITYLPNVSEWVSKIYCFEDESDTYGADDVLGGVKGVDNAQGQALTNRTNFLKDNLVKLAEIVSAMQLALGPMLTTIKKLTVQAEEITDWEHEAWLSLEDTAEARRLYERIAGTVPVVKLTFEGGSQIVRPICEITLENGKTFFLRTDGQSSIVPKVEEYLEPIGE